MYGSKPLQQLAFASLALSCLPASTLLFLLNYLYISAFPVNPIHKRLRRAPGFRSRTVLITGVSTPAGLRLARAFHRTGHCVLGADFEPRGLRSPARLSRALKRFYPLTYEPAERCNAQYANGLLQVVEHGRVDLWIDCSINLGLELEAHAREAIEKNTRCQCFAVRPPSMPYLVDRQALLEYLVSRGLPAPESHQVTSRTEVHNVLGRSGGGRKYLLQTLEQNGADVNTAQTKLPRRTLSQTYDTVSQISIADATPWKLEQDIDGLERYTTSAIIVRGTVKAFVASHLDEGGRHRLFDPKSALSRSMLRVVQVFARKEGPELTTHCGIDFCVDEQVAEKGVIVTVLPVKISFHCQDTLQLFEGIDGSTSLSKAYLSCLDEHRFNGQKGMTRPLPTILQQQDTGTDDTAVPDKLIPGVYSFGQDLVSLGLKPLLNLLTFRIGMTCCLYQISNFLYQLLFWQECFYDFDDPLPFWLAYQINVPLRLIHSIFFGDTYRWGR